MYIMQCLLLLCRAFKLIVVAYTREHTTIAHILKWHPTPDAVDRPVFAASNLNEIAIIITKRKLHHVNHHLKMNNWYFVIVKGLLFVKILLMRFDR